MGKILCIDTATDICSVAISENGNVWVYRDSEDDRSHSVNLAVYVDDLLQKSDLKVSDLDAIAISKGPGSYTGLRIGVSLAKGLCYGSGVPLVSVSTLQAMCHGVPKAFLQHHHLTDFYFAPMLDARRMEVYTAVYTSNYEKALDVNALILDENAYRANLNEKPVLFFGTGAAKSKDTITHKNALFFDGYKHSARYMISIAEAKLQKGQTEDVAYFEPFYLKDFITTTPKKNILLGNKQS